MQSLISKYNKHLPVSAHPAARKLLVLQETLGIGIFDFELATGPVPSRRPDKVVIVRAGTVKASIIHKVR